MPRPPEACCAANQGCDVLDVELGRGALGEVLPKDIVEPVKRGVGSPFGAVGIL